MSGLLIDKEKIIERIEDIKNVSKELEMFQFIGK